MDVTSILPILFIIHQINESLSGEEFALYLENLSSILSN